MIFLIAAILLQRPDIVLADFEQPTYGTWISTGTAFGTGPAQGGFANQMKVTGYLGHGLVDTYLPGDEAEGTLTSPPFKVNRKYINFLIGGGYQPGNAGIKLLIGDHTKRDATGTALTSNDTEALAWRTWNVSQFQGHTARIEIYDHARGQWGHINIDQIEESDTAKTKPVMTTPLYHEEYRPQFHFSARHNWLNDPNGLVYANHVWHLFFQYNSKGIHSDYKNWGHAESPDLFHWKELPVAIAPDDLGEIWSGSGAIDRGNTSGLGTNGQPPLVAMYTAAGSKFGQCLASSTDGGLQWHKYAGNPVLPQIADGNRDPHIFWYEPKKEWILVLYIEGNTFGIFASPNLKEWQEQSRFTVEDTAECPELFPIAVSGEKTQIKWVFYAGNYHYVVGEFDGVHFTPDQAPIKSDYGDCFYASQTYNDVPQGRRVQIGWMNGLGPLPGNPFNQQMSIPCDLTLHATDSGYRVYRWPVKEIEDLRKSKLAGDGLTLAKVNQHLEGLTGDLYDLSFQIHFDGNTPVKLNLRGTVITLDPASQTAEVQGVTAPMNLSDGSASVRLLVDRSSLEIFINHGIDSITRYFEPPATDHAISITGGAAEVDFTGYELKSIWP